LGASIFAPLADCEIRVSLDEQLTFRFVEERDFHPEELEIARALATQASLAIQLTRLAQAARQAVVLEERNRLAGEIHDGLAQSFTAICMQLGVAKEEQSSKEGDALCSIQRAIEVAKFGLAEARRCAHNLRSSNESGLAVVQRCLLYYRQTALPLRISSSYPRKSLALVQTAEQKHLFQFRFAVRSFDRKDW
jgi:signal transduction histidine kinase